jgi:hypothetical protein
MTYIALNFARYVNAVAMRHGEVSREMFRDHAIDAIPNGVHTAIWTAPAFRAVFDRHIPRWRGDNLKLRYAMDIPESEIADAHLQGKRALSLEQVILPLFYGQHDAWRRIMRSTSGSPSLGTGSGLLVSAGVGIWDSSFQMHFNRPETLVRETASIQQDRGIFRLSPPLALRMH